MECPRCGDEGIWLTAYKRYYCHKCWEYIPEPEAESSGEEEYPLKVVLVQAEGGGRTGREPKFLYASFFRHRVLNSIQIYKGLTEGPEQSQIFNDELLAEMTYGDIVGSVDEHFTYELGNVERILPRVSPVFGPELIFEFTPGREFKRGGEMREAQGLPIQKKNWEDVLRIVRTYYSDKFEE